MNENELFAMLGRKQALVEAQAAAYRALIDVFAKVVSGEIDTARVVVNLTDQTWSYAAPGERPASVMQINGLPNVVMDFRVPRSELETAIANLIDAGVKLRDEIAALRAEPKPAT